MAVNDKAQGVKSGLIISSVSCAIALDKQKEKKSCIVIAYAIGGGDDIRYTAIKLPKKQTYKRDDFLSAICQVEKVTQLTYVDFDGKDKDIYVCRAKEGEVFDFVERDNLKNSFGEGFAEIESSQLRFATTATEAVVDEKNAFEVAYNIEASKYEKDSLQYAVINAYNACLLGRIFSLEEFQLETADRERVKYEIRAVSAKYIDLQTLYIKPEIIEGEDIYQRTVGKRDTRVRYEKISPK
jgi:hypothetical protein